MTKQEAGAILDKFRQNVLDYLILDPMDINRNCTVGEKTADRLVRLVHDALPWPDEVATKKEALLLDALQHVAANCGPCRTDHAGPALEKYQEIMGGEQPAPQKRNVGIADVIAVQRMGASLGDEENDGE